MIVVACGAIALGGGAAVAAVAADSGDPAGLALLARVREAYAHVPGVAITGSANLPGLGHLRVRFTQLLRKSRIVAEEGDITGSGTTRTLVKRLGTATFVRDTGDSCWREIPATDPADLTDVGLRFLGAYRQRLGKPRRSGTSWLLPARAQDKDGTKGQLTYRIDRASLAVISLTAVVQGGKVVERFRSLRSTPKLAVPKPPCGAPA
jgi:hypothetical protein